MRVIVRLMTPLVVAVVAAACGSQSSTPAPITSCVEPATGLPTDVFCTGLYVDADTAKIASDVMPYTPATTLWSDGAEKRRYLQLPAGAQIDTADMDAWRFPVGTKAWKEFRLDGALVETRMFWKRTETTWESGTYVWDATGKTAALNTAAKGTVLPSGYEIPVQKDCDKCHHGGADKLLGVEAVALALEGAQGATLSVLAARGLLSKPPSSTTLKLPEDATGKAAAALGYLHANCGMPCHSSRGLGDETQLVMRLRAGEFWPTPAAVDALDAYRATVGQAPTTSSVAHAFPGASRITRGAHDKSLVWLLSHLRGNYQMPPLVSHRIDDAGTQHLAEWIDALTP